MNKQYTYILPHKE